MHRLDDNAPAWDVLCQLLEVLPSNGHVVVSSRTAPRLPVARMLRQDDAIVITEADMAFDDDELAEVAVLRDIPPTVAAELPRWPALATLVGAFGRSESIVYLWDEVLRALPAPRRRLLAAVVPFGEIDDDLVAALGGTISAKELVDGIPLVDATDAGTIRLHDLWSEALTGVIDTEERNNALRAGGDMLLARGEVGRAAEAFALASDEAGLSEVMLAIARRPTMVADIPEVNRVHSLLPMSMRRGAGSSSRSPTISSGRTWGPGTA